MQLREAKPVGSLDHHHGGIGHVDADLDHRGRDQDVDLAAGEALHHHFLVLEPAVNQAHPHRFGEDILPEPFELGGRGTGHDRFGLLDERTDDEGLVTGRDLFAHEVIGQIPVFGVDHLRLDRDAAQRHLVDDGQRHLPVHRQRQRAWDGRGGHGKEVRPASAFGAQQLALASPEPVLLVDDCETQVEELDLVLDQGVRADHERAVARRRGGAHPAALRGALAADQKLDLQVGKRSFEVSAELVQVLPRQDLRGGHHDRLHPRGVRHRGAGRSDRRLA